jgi:SAM-dependent methyltransferase
MDSAAAEMDIADEVDTGIAKEKCKKRSDCTKPCPIGQKHRGPCARDVLLIASLSFNVLLTCALLELLRHVSSDSRLLPSVRHGSGVAVARRQLRPAVGTHHFAPFNFDTVDLAKASAMDDCDSYLACSLSPQARDWVRLSSTWVHGLRHVPSWLVALPTKDERRVFGNFSTRTPELYAPIRKLGNLSCELSKNSTLLEACNYYRWDEFDPRTPMLPPWPERAQFAQLKQAWSRLPVGSLPFPNCDRNKWNWYCGHFSDVYFFMHARGVLQCVSPSGILERSDVRLVVDVSGGTAAFAAGVQAVYGDRLVTLTTNIFSSEMEQAHDQGGYQGKSNFPPIHEANGIRGFASVTSDLFSFLPFGESTMDVIHTRWAYHSGFPRATLYEFQRVLRPGGWLILRQMAGHPVTSGTLDRVVVVAKGMGWRRARTIDANHTWRTTDRADNHTALCGDMLMIFQMPVPRKWGLMAP